MKKKAELRVQFRVRMNVQIVKFEEIKYKNLTRLFRTHAFMLSRFSKPGDF